MKPKGTETEHTMIIKKAGQDECWSISTVKELADIFNTIVGQTARSMKAAEIRQAFEDGIKEWGIS